MVECGQDADGGLHAAHHVEQRDARPHGFAIGVAGQAHHAGDGLHHEVIAGQWCAEAWAEPGDGRVDDARVRLPHRLVVEAEPGHAAGLHILDEDVGLVRQRKGDGPIRGVLQVKGYGALVAIYRQVVGGLTITRWRRPRASVVTFRAFDLDDVGAHVGQQHGAVRPGQDA